MARAIRSAEAQIFMKNNRKMLSFRTRVSPQGRNNQLSAAMMSDEQETKIFVRTLSVEYHDFSVFTECTTQPFCFADRDFRHSSPLRNRFGKVFCLGNEAFRVNIL